MPLVSIIIPVFNQGKALCRALRSLQKQTYQDFEIIIVDDGSDVMIDMSVLRRKIDIPLLRIKHTQNLGAPSARITGFIYASGSYLLFLDADIELRSTCLEQMMRALDTHPDAAFAYAGYWFGYKKCSSFPFDPERLKQHNYIHTSSLIRRSCFPGFDFALKRFQDWDLWLTMMEQGKQGILIEHMLFRIRPGGTMSRWVPSIALHISWEKLGWIPKRIQAYRNAECIVRKKHGL